MIHGHAAWLFWLRYCYQKGKLKLLIMRF
jgi:hypothetical protein